MTIEAQYGVPTVAMHTDKFDRVVRSVAAVNGMAELRQVFVPQPVMGKSPRELRAYVDGRDPLTGRPVMQEVIEGLTTPLDGRGIGTVEYDRSTPRLVEPDTEENPTPRRTRHRGEPAPLVHGKPLAGLPADRAPHGRARGRDAGRDAPQTGRGRGPHAPDAFPGGMGIHRREGRGERGDGRREAGG